MYVYMDLVYVGFMAIIQIFRYIRLFINHLCMLVLYYNIVEFVYYYYVEHKTLGGNVCS